jgi:predicted unusual protein kinase regulating ubiquinone biosynthesis (AarF/ABC1/UbiB family)
LNDEQKTKDQIIDELIDELAELRRRVIELEESETDRKQLEEQQGMKIGEILIEMGLLARSELEEYLRRQRAEILSYMLEYKQRRIGEILIESGIITEEELRSALSKQRTKRHQRQVEDMT